MDAKEMFNKFRLKRGFRDRHLYELEPGSPIYYLRIGIDEKAVPAIKIANDIFSNQMTIRCEGKTLKGVDYNFIVTDAMLWVDAFDFEKEDALRLGRHLDAVITNPLGV